MRLIDADAFADFLKNAIKKQRCDALKVNDAALSVGDVLESVVAELEGTSLDGFKNNPTIEPQRIEGRWIDTGRALRWECSNCGRRDNHIYNYCPDCGARMRNEDGGWN